MMEGVVTLPHVVSVDESQDATDGGTMFKAFCDTCEWSGEVWEHADDFQDDENGEDPAGLAYAAAEREGLAHIEDMG